MPDTQKRIHEFTTPETAGYTDSSNINEDDIVLAGGNKGQPSQDDIGWSFTRIFQRFLYKIRSYIRTFTEDEFTDDNMIPNVLYTAANKTQLRHTGTITFKEDGMGDILFLTGNLSFDFTDAKRGATVQILHNDASEPDWTGLPLKFELGSQYVVGGNNLFTLRYWTDTFIYASIVQLGDNTPVAITTSSAGADGHNHSNLSVINAITNAGSGQIITDAERLAIGQINPLDKGFKQTPAQLVADHPTGQEGWYALVGSTDTFWAWDTDTSQWLDTTSSAPSSVIPNFAGIGSNGLVPDPGAGSTLRVLHADGSWAIPEATPMSGAEIESALDTELGNTDWKTGGSQGSDFDGTVTAGGGTFTIDDANHASYNNKVLIQGNNGTLTLATDIPNGFQMYIRYNRTDYLLYSVLSSGGWRNKNNNTQYMGAPNHLVKVTKIDGTFVWEDFGYDSVNVLQTSSTSILLNALYCQGIALNYTATNSSLIYFYTTNFLVGDWITITKTSSGGQITVSNGSGFTIYGNTTISTQGKSMTVFCPASGVLIVEGGES